MPPKIHPSDKAFALTFSKGFRPSSGTLPRSLRNISSVHQALQFFVLNKKPTDFVIRNDGMVKLNPELARHIACVISRKILPRKQRDKPSSSWQHRK
jgi:hypothetical protein